jgi:succinate dehydrogenase/fumarate reductase flavoprotein subunit
MPKYDPIFLENAPRGKLVEAIFNEIHEGRGPIYWQLPEKIPEFITARYGWAGMEGKKIQIEIDYQRLLGGAKINERAETSVKGLYAAGESAGGFHGADRMQNASFLECTIFGARAGRSASEYASRADVQVDMSEVNEEIARLREVQARQVGPDPSEMFEAVQNIMWKYCSVVKQADEMKKCLELIIGLREKKPCGKNLFAALDATNLALAAEMVTRASLTREETRGMHIRRDYPVRDDAKWMKHVVIENRDAEVTTTIIPVTRINL